jgi:hypothetical protein
MERGMKKFSELQELAEDMVEADSERDKMFKGMDDMFNLVWNLPQTMEVMKWLRIVKSTDPYDQIRAGTRVLTTLKETVKIDPFSDDPTSQEKANLLEHVLKSNMVNATRRRGVNIIADLVMSGLMYGEICAQLLYLPYQNKIPGIGGNRLNSMKRLGPFVVIPHKPQTVHTSYSHYMMEAVLSVTETTPQKLKYFWGDKVPATIADNDSLDEVYCFDYWDYDQRTVWVGLSPDVYNLEENMQIMDEPWTAPFIPWVSMFDGTTLQGDAGNQRLPLLYPAYQSKQWATQNITGTIALSEAIAHMAAPRVKFSGPGADGMQIEYGNPEGAVALGPGQDVTPLAPPIMDQGMMAMADRQRAAMSRSGISDTLMGASVDSNTSFSTYSLNVQNSMSVIRPYQTLAERAYSELYMVGAQWVHFCEDELVGLGMGKEDKGKLYKISYKDFDPDKIIIYVTLNPDLPVDRQQKINGAVMLTERLGMTKAAALEEVGIEDANGMLRDKMYEQLLDSKIKVDIMKDQMQVDIEGKLALQAETMKMQMMMQQQNQMHQQQMQSPGQPQGPTPGQMSGIPQYPQTQTPGTPPGLPDQVSGQGYNPAEGGQPPIQAMPGTGREGQTGKTRAQP